MEKRKVIIDLEHYDDLMELKHNVENGNVFTVFDFIPGPSLSNQKDSQIATKFYTENEVIGNLTDKNKKLKSKINKIESDIKKMSIWQFYKWRKT